MPGCATFADVFEARLNAGAEIPPTQASRVHCPVLTPPPFDFRGPQFHFASTPYASLGERPPRRARPAIALTAREQRALAALNDLGAEVDDTVSTFELRRAFRRLARVYHPDRHPHSSDAEKVRLSRLFSGLADGYHLLAAALDARAAQQ